MDFKTDAGPNDRSGDSFSPREEKEEVYESNKKENPTPVRGHIVQDGAGDRMRHQSVDKHGMRLHPQPTNDTLDPLNWSKTKKHSILAIVMAL